jgi:hypothetical protein
VQGRSLLPVIQILAKPSLNRRGKGLGDYLLPLLCVPFESSEAKHPHSTITVDLHWTFPQFGGRRGHSQEFTSHRVRDVERSNLLDSHVAKRRAAFGTAYRSPSAAFNTMPFRIDDEISNCEVSSDGFFQHRSLNSDGVKPTPLLSHRAGLSAVALSSFHPPEETNRRTREVNREVRR